MGTPEQEVSLVDRLAGLGIKVKPVKNKPDQMQFPVRFKTADQVQAVLEQVGFETVLTPKRATAMSSPCNGQMRTANYVAILPPETIMRGKMFYSRLVQIKLR